MDPQDHLRALLDGVTCTVCEDRVPPERVRLLAWRDDLAFLQIECKACRSTTLGFVMADVRPSEPPEPSEEARRPVSADDVLDMHEFLTGWRGNLEALVGPGPGQPRREGVATPGRPRRRAPDRRS
jgi:hypothetical protein